MKDDHGLVRFVQTHRLEPPLPDPELEGRLMAELEPGGRSFFWLKIMVALGLAGTLWGWRRLQIANSVDPTQIEAYLILNWDASTTRSEDLTIDLFTYQEN